MTTSTLVAHSITKKYKDVEVLHPTNITIESGKIYGLIGRNGAGKTTLLSILTAQNAATSGHVTYGGMPVWENRSALEHICFSREISPTLTMGPNTYKVKHYLKMAKTYYPLWDEAYAQRLIAEFELDTKKKIHKLSKGMMSMLTIVLALASRAPITILDEPVAGLDIAMRDRFYKALLDDYEKTSRTFIVSTHIIEEAANIFEEIIVVDKGNIIAKENTDEFLAGFHFLSGREDLVDSIVANMAVLNTESLGRQKVVCVRCSLQELQQKSAGKQVDIAPVPLHKAFLYLSGGEKGGNIA